jgi:hypothetical protein
MLKCLRNLFFPGYFARRVVADWVTDKRFFLHLAYCLSYRRRHRTTHTRTTVFTVKFANSMKEKSGEERGSIVHV